ncbi:hypothetical protein OIU77_009933 [Salix suchowensis]|uniref:Uncharacterized protein n=1 Tax=Salix suchowensis TaxID=1278906 RepID=A0ABQ9A7P6_9ROSI|nr:hypothetical protein OIU77_009933 [Salix suchowensis]
MARGLKLGCSYKRSTLIVCSINIVVALYVLRSLYASLYLYTNSDFDKVVKYTPDQVKNMEESIRIRRAKEPVELVKIVKELKEEFNRGEMVAGLPKEVKDKITDEILQRLRSLNANANDKHENLVCWILECSAYFKYIIHQRTTYMVYCGGGVEK